MNQIWKFNKHFFFTFNIQPFVPLWTYSKAHKSINKKNREKNFYFLLHIPCHKLISWRRFSLALGKKFHSQEWEKVLTNSIFFCFTKQDQFWHILVLTEWKKDSQTLSLSASSWYIEIFFHIFFSSLFLLFLDVKANLMQMNSVARESINNNSEKVFS